LVGVGGLGVLGVGVVLFKLLGKKGQVGLPEVHPGWFDGLGSLGQKRDKTQGQQAEGQRQ
jgi:hypothetical protein